MHLLHAEISQIGFARASCRAPDVRPRCCAGQCSGQTQYNAINTPMKQERVRTVEGEENSARVICGIHCVVVVVYNTRVLVMSGDDALL